MNKPILNLDELEPIPLDVLNKQYGGNAMPEKFGGGMAPIGHRLGAQKLGCNLTVVPPGKRAFPFHAHRVNEEMFFVIEGARVVRIGGETWPIRAGDVICCPPGGPETAHQIVNTGDAVLRYLAVSTSQTPELCEYPDSGKFAVMHMAGRDADGKPQGFRHVGRAADGRDYWDGE